jgi:hypothetical protein
MLASGIDPGEVEKAQKAAGQERTANSFEVVGRKSFETWKNGISPASASRTRTNLEWNVFPRFGGVPAAEIRPKAILETLRTMEARGVGNTVKEMLRKIASGSRRSRCR